MKSSIVISNRNVNAALQSSSEANGYITLSLNLTSINRKCLHFGKSYSLQNLIKVKHDSTQGDMINCNIPTCNMNTVYANWQTYDT